MNAEDVYFYLDLTKNYLKKKDVIKAIEYYIAEKNKININGHYSVLLFQEEGNPIFINDKKNSEIIAKSVDENWKLRPKEESFFENGLFYIFSYIAETVRKKAKFNRIIVITDTPSDLNEEYQEALFNLVSKIKTLPTFIDIIRVSEKDVRFHKDDVKLNILVSDTKGGIFYISEKKDFQKVIKSLVKNKQLVSIFADEPYKMEISRDDYLFYSRLAKQLKKHHTMQDLVCYLCGDGICPICRNAYDIPLICDDCSTPFHKCCVTDYTIENNIGIPHIFRCPSSNCDVLLQIEEDEVVGISTEAPEYSQEIEDILTVKEYLGFEEEKETKISDKLETKVLAISEKDIHKIPEINLNPQEDVQTVRVGGFFGGTYTVKKVGNKFVYNKTSESNKAQFKSQKEEMLLKPENKHLNEEDVINFCSVCGSKVSSHNQRICSNCGSQLK